MFGTPMIIGVILCVISVIGVIADTIFDLYFLVDSIGLTGMAGGLIMLYALLGITFGFVQFHQV